MSKFEMNTYMYHIRLHCECAV